jgi:L-arabinose isomerase
MKHKPPSYVAAWNAQGGAFHATTSYSAGAQEQIQEFEARSYLSQYILLNRDSNDRLFEDALIVWPAIHPMSSLFSFILP